MLLLIVGGLARFRAIHQKIFPDIDVEVISIGVAYLGAAPEEVEEGVCIRIEEEIQGIEGIEQITSSAAEGACGVSAELISGYPVDRALAEIKNAVDAHHHLPRGDREADRQPHLRSAATRSSSRSPATSRRRRSRSSASGCATGSRRCRASPRSTSATRATTRSPSRCPRSRCAATVSPSTRWCAPCAAGSLDRPGGSIKTSSGEVLLRTKGQAYTGEEFERIVVLTREDGTRLLLGEVARVVDGFEDDDRWARFDGEPAVLIQVYPRGRAARPRARRAGQGVRGRRRGAASRGREAHRLGGSLPDPARPSRHPDPQRRQRLHPGLRRPRALPAPAPGVLGVDQRAPVVPGRALALSDARDLDRRDLALRLHHGAGAPRRRRDRGGRERPPPPGAGGEAARGRHPRRPGGDGAGHLRRAHHDGGLPAPGALARRDGADLRRHRDRGDRLPLLLAAGVAARAAGPPRACRPRARDARSEATG